LGLLSRNGELHVTESERIIQTDSRDSFDAHSSPF